MILSGHSTRLWRQQFTNSCTFCREVADGADEDAADGRRIVGDAPFVKTIYVSRSAKSLSVIVYWHLAHQVSLDPDGSTRQSFDDASGRQALTLAWTHGRWKVIDLRVVT